MNIKIAMAEEIKKTTESVEETVTPQTPEEQPTVPRSRAFMTSKYPDAQWESDDDYENALANHLEETSSALDTYRETDERIMEILERDPDFALVLDDMGKGVPFRVALHRHLGDLSVTPEEEDRDYDDWKKAGDEYLAEKKRIDDEINTRNGNIEESTTRFKNFVDSHSDWDEAKKEGFVKFFNSVCQDLAIGKLTDNVLSMLADAYTHDDDVEAALEEGKVEARNKKIVAERIRKETGDGVPAGGGANPDMGPREPEEDEDVLDEISRRSRRNKLFNQ